MRCSSVRLVRGFCFTLTSGWMPSNRCGMGGAKPRPARVQRFHGRRGADIGAVGLPDGAVVSAGVAGLPPLVDGDGWQQSVAAFGAGAAARPEQAATVFTMAAISAGVIGTGGASSGHGGGCLAFDFALWRLRSALDRAGHVAHVVLEASSRLASRSRSSARPRTPCANWRAAVSASNWRLAGGAGMRFNDEEEPPPSAGRRRRGCSARR